ncbi:glycosyltransferase family 2 protein [Sphingobacterium sp. PCS056]|uniref:glycosyltransferase family A protein n=1 Tax=Sphingobacterium sp. PCS056 TaxID=2931400 RepID=UPI0020104803|nr:glycosyltransferase family A protein [Sphingobacterium sp. PCS056]UPZ37483.1 glycosyltransferase family 2 protein [Sphingobacterium sp. PCS056]
MISAFLLNSKCDDSILESSTLDINPIEIVEDHNIFRKFRSVIEWGISTEEDAIYCIYGDNFRSEFNIDSLNKVINEIALEGIYSLYVNAIYDDFITINNDLIAISSIKSVSSFILLKPIYEFAISLLDLLDDNPNIDFLVFLEHAIPNSFLLLEQNKLNIKQHMIHIISPYRNVINYIDDYIISILKQKFTNYNVILIDDCSNDGSYEKIPERGFIKKIINSERKFALQNIIDVLINEKFDDDDIICLVDADDILANQYVLDIINQTYSDNSVMMTYGSMSYLGSIMKLGLPYDREEFNDLRKATWKMSHMRTFKYRVFRELVNQDKNLAFLRDDMGSIFKMPYDMALLLPMMELVGYDGVRFISSPTYKYRLHSNNDHNTNIKEQHSGEVQIRNKPSFNRFY